MRLLRMAEVPADARETVFSYSRALPVAVAAAVIAASAAVVLVDWPGRKFPGYLISGGALLFLLLCSRYILARFRPSNWLVRMRADGVYVQFRSYLNYHFPAADPTVVFIVFREIASARLVRERSVVRSGFSSRSQQTRRYVELELAAETEGLAKALAAEEARPGPIERSWYGTSSTVYRHYPVRMSVPPLLRVEWTGVPGADSFLEALRPHATVAPPVKTELDFSFLQALPREEQLSRLRELVARGQEVAAIYAARRLYGTSLVEAKSLVDSLRAEPGAATMKGNAIGLDR